MSSAASDSPPPQEPARSNRVCLNCRRKKKRCDKALPSCGRCTYSLEVCQHEGDVLESGVSSASGEYPAALFNFESLVPRQSISPSLAGLESSFGTPQRRTSDVPSTIVPATFSSLDAGEDIHSYVFRSVSRTIGDRFAVEKVAEHYFRTINAWFTIVEQNAFVRNLNDTYATPSAETGLIALAMFLVLRKPQDVSLGGDMADGVYLAIKALLATAQSKVDLSVPMLQAQLLVALYECSNSLPRQAYMSLGACAQMFKSFGWHNRASWSGHVQRNHPRETKMHSILAWATSFIESHLVSAYPEHSMPQTVPNCDFPFLFPEALDQYLQTNRSLSQMQSLDEDVSSIETMVWPEAKSAFYLCIVLRRAGGEPPKLAAEMDTGQLSESITAHAINMMSGFWKYGNRMAAVFSAFMALLKLNEPLLAQSSPIITTSLTPAAPLRQQAASSHRRPIDTVTSVINVIYTTSQSINDTGDILRGHPVPTSACVCMWQAAMVLIEHGNLILQDAAWVEKVNSLKQTLAIFAKRWRIADGYIRDIDAALLARLSPFARSRHPSGSLT